MEKQMIDMAYDVAKDKYGKNAFTFADLWKKVVREKRFDKDEQEQAGYVYTEMLQDNRFIFIGNSEWKLAEFLTEDELREHANALYDFKQEAVDEEARIKKLDKDDDYLYEDEETAEEYGQNRNNNEFDDEESEDEEEDGEEDKDNDDEPIDENEEVNIDDINEK